MTAHPIFVLSIVIFGVSYPFLVSKFDKSVKGIVLDVSISSFKNGVNQFLPNIGGWFNIYIPLFMIGVAAPTLIYILVFSVIEMISMVFRETPFDFEIVQYFAVSVILTGFMTKPLIAAVNSSHSIRVVDEGLLVRVYNLRFYWVFVPWEEIEDIVPSSKLLPYGYTYWIIKIINISDSNLTQGSRAVREGRSGILLSQYIRQRSKLISIIEQRLNVESDKDLGLS